MACRLRGFANCLIGLFTYLLWFHVYNLTLGANKDPDRHRDAIVHLRKLQREIREERRLEREKATVQLTIESLKKRLINDLSHLSGSVN